MKIFIPLIRTAKNIHVFRNFIFCDQIIVLFLFFMKLYFQIQPMLAVPQNFSTICVFVYYGYMYSFSNIYFKFCTMNFHISIFFLKCIHFHVPCLLMNTIVIRSWKIDNFIQLTHVNNFYRHVHDHHWILLVSVLTHYLMFHLTKFCIVF